MISRVMNFFRSLPAPRSLRKQLLVISLLILSVLLLLIGILQYVLMRDFIYTSRAESLETQMRSVPRELFFSFLDSSEEGLIPPGMTRPPIPNNNSEDNVNNGETSSGQVVLPDDRDGVIRRPLFLDAHTTIAIYSSKGTFKDLQDETLADTAAPRLSNEEYNELLLSHATDKATGEYKIIASEDGSEHIAVFMNLGRPGDSRMLLQMSVDTASLTNVIMQQLLIFVALSVTALLAGLFLYLPALRKTLVPLSNMGEAAQSIDAGNLDIRFPVNQGQAEIDKLSLSFNGMLERLEISFHNEREAKEQMRRFVADASHELRTPLTSIHGFLEVLLRGAVDNKDQLNNALRSMYGESKRINKLVEDLLLLARMEGAPKLRINNIMLSEIIAEMQSQLNVLAGNRKVTFDIAYGIRGKYDSDKIKQVVLNLFHNAVQHTDAEQGTIYVSLHASNNQAILTVRDNGIGISAEHLPHIFDRFYRSDSSRTRKYGGSGLGLSITKSIVEAHSGEIRVKSSPGEGTTFKVTLPCLKD